VPVRLSLNVGPMLRYVEAEKTYWDQARDEGLTDLAQEGVRILREEVPKGKTRQMEQSCTYRIEGNKITVLPDVPYAPIIDGEGRTTASPGRYVPRIDKRLVRPSKRNPNIGLHPGAKKTPFSSRTVERWRAEAEEYLRIKVRERR